MDFAKFFDLSKCLEFLKLSAAQFFALAAIFGLFLQIARWNWIPPLEPWMVHAAAFGFITAGVLGVVGACTAIYRLFPVDRWFMNRLHLRSEQRELEKYLPHMTEDEKEIVSYLLAKKQKSFTGSIDGGYASTLIARNIVRNAARPGQHFSMEEVPMFIPDHLWDILAKHEGQFPYTPPKKGERETHPWRVPWMAR